MPNGNTGFTETDWTTLLIHIRRNKCTPFLGSGAAWPTLPLGREIAEKWAKEKIEEKSYPFPDRHNLPRVAQYVAVHHRSAVVVKSKMIDELKGKGPPPNDADEPHRVLAELNLPLYLTTNYDDFMYKALIRDDPKRTPTQEHCHWYEPARDGKIVKAKLPHAPTPEKPIVYHLHGVLSEIDSLVLTEDDYLNFLILVSEHPELIPPQVRGAFGNSSLLFLGYSLEDLDFRVLFRRLASFMKLAVGIKHVSVQVEPKPGGTEKERIEEAKAQREYMEEELDGQDVKMVWMPCDEFARELAKRWRRGDGK